MSDLRQTIVLEIKRLAATNGGRPLGRRSFERETGIREADWCGVFWARWSDALLEAGFRANEMQGRADRTELLEKLALSCVHYQKMPTVAEYELLRAQDASFPSYKTFQSNFGAKENIVWELRQWLTQVQDPQALLELLPTGRPKSVPHNPRNRSAPTFGYVYLLHSGQHYKIGRSDELEKRMRQISVALPETVKLVHAIRTDDPAGIEAYWHRRFVDRRANGEWFKLAPADLLAFKRRKSQ